MSQLNTVSLDNDRTDNDRKIIKIRKPSANKPFIETAKSFYKKSR